jgi:phospholipase D1/2
LLFLGIKFLLSHAQGVEIYILLWNNIETAFQINATYVLEHLPGLNPENIFVKTHPPKSKLLIWSHHQKTVTIDDKVTFVGGIGMTPRECALLVVLCFVL